MYMGTSTMKGVPFCKRLLGSEACCEYTISKLWSHQVGRAAWDDWHQKPGAKRAWGAAGDEPPDDKKWVAVGLNRTLASVQAGLVFSIYLPRIFVSLAG